MKQEKEFLINELEFFIKEKIINTNKVKNAIDLATEENALIKYFEPLKIDKIFKLNIPFKMMTPLELCNITRYLQRVYSMNIDLSYWFTKEEIEGSLEDVIPLKTSNKLVLKNVLFNGDKDFPEFRLFMTHKQLKENLSDTAFISYNTAAQRIGVVKTRGPITVVEPTIYDGAVSNIAKLVAREKFKSNDIILNILKTEEKWYHYDKENMTLTIDMEKVQLDIADGAHRYYGILKGLDENPNAQGCIGITIFNMDIEKIGEVVYQISLTNEHNKELITKYDQTNVLTKFIKELNTSYDKESNFLFGTIDLYSSNEENSPIIKYDILYKDLVASGVYEYVHNSKLIENKKLKEFLIEFYSLFSELYKERYEDVKPLETGTFLCGLLYTAFEFFKRTNTIKIENIEKIVENIDFENETYIYDYPMTDSTRREMSKTFKKLLKNVRLG